MTKEQEENFLEYCNGLSLEEKENLYNYLLFRILVKKLAEILRKVRE